MPSQHGGEIHGTGALRSVKTPDGLGAQRVHVHGLGPVTPAGRYRQGDPNIFAREFLFRGGRFRDTPDGGVGDHAMDGVSVWIPHVCRYKFGHGFGHVHGLAFKGLPNPTQAPVDRGANTYGREISVPTRVIYAALGHAYAPSCWFTLIRWGGHFLSNATRPQVQVMNSSFRGVLAVLVVVTSTHHRP